MTTALSPARLNEKVSLLASGAEFSTPRRAKGADGLPVHSMSGGHTTPRPRDTRLAIRFLAILFLLFTSTCLMVHHDVFAPPAERVTSLHPRFLAECHSLLKPRADTHTSRLEALSAVLSSSSTDTDAKAVWLAEPGASAFYYTGAFSSSDWFLSERPFLIAISPSTNSSSSADILFLTPEFEKLRAQLLPLPQEVQARVRWVSWREHESPYLVLERALGHQTAIILDGRVREFVGAGVRSAFGYEVVRAGEGMKGDVQVLRERKDEREIGLLRCANQMTLHAIRKTRSRMRFGITESRTGEILRAEMRAVGLSGGDGLVLFGENAALPHGSGTDRKLTKMDMILIDAGGKWGGYVADITRTFALPKSQISNHHLRIWETVRRAQLAAHDRLLYPSHHASTNTSTLFSDLDIAARAVISHAYPTASPAEPFEPDYSVFTHRLGHGIGLEGHESPYVVQGPLGSGAVQPGHVFSLEPGVYLPRVDGEGEGEGEGVGVRLEDCFVVTDLGEGKLGGRWLSGPVRSWGEV